MTLPIHDSPLLGHLRAEQDRGQGVVRTAQGVAVLDPELAPVVNAENFNDTTLPDRLVDLLRRRKSPRVQWKEVRAAWVPNLQKLKEPSQIAALESRLRVLIDERIDREIGGELGGEIDLMLAIQTLFSRALIPTVIADLSPAEQRRVEADQDLKIGAVTGQEPPWGAALEGLRSSMIQVRASRVARRVLRQRSLGQRPRCLDLADPIVDLLPKLGPDRASHAVTSVLTAIAGPPGAVAVCLLFELSRRPEWAERIAREQATIDSETYHAGAMGAAPITHRFVKETLRRWSAPLILQREVRADLCVAGLGAGQEKLQAGEQFLASPYLIHHHASAWKDPEVFDPDRWLPDSPRGPAHSCAYAPFGWAPTSCIGAGIGLVQLMLLARLFSLEYQLRPANLDGVEFRLSAVAVPHGFRGSIISSARRTSGRRPAS